MAVIANLKIDDKNLENLRKIKDPKNVLAIKPVKDNGKYLVRAIVKTGEGEYEILNLSSHQSGMSFPFYPLETLSYYLGALYFENFVMLEQFYAFNKDYFTGFSFRESEDSPHIIETFAKFNDMSSTICAKYNKKSFYKKDIYKLKHLMKDMGMVPNYTTSELNVIDDYYDNGTAVIPKLKKQTKQSDNIM